MHVDVGNYVSFNSIAARNLGLTSAVYCSELLSEYDSRKKDNATDDGFFEVDRARIERRTSIDADSQRKCDDSLSKIGIVELSSLSADILRFNPTAYAKAIVREDKSISSVARKQAKRSSKPKKSAIADALKSNINAKDSRLRDSLGRWVDALIRTNKLSSESVAQFQSTLSKYAGEDIDLAVEIVDTAIAQKYVNCVWAIESHERGKSLMRRPSINVATKTSLSEKKY